jgi:chromosome condensin MukBEF complex kleisin-like MukF subunit
VPRSTATTEPLTPRWLDAYRARIDPQLTPLQRLASEAIWAWFDELWEGGQVDASRLVDLQDEVLALFERIETSTGPLRDEAIVELVDRLRSIDRAVFFRR